MLKKISDFKELHQLIRKTDNKTKRVTFTASNCYKQDEKDSNGGKMLHLRTSQDPSSVELVSCVRWDNQIGELGLSQSVTQ